MSSSSMRNSLRLGVAACFLALLALLLCGCFANTKEASNPASPEYQEAIATFYTGTIGLQTGDRSGIAQAELNKAVILAPQEPAAWANLALMQMRNGDLKKAGESLKSAVEKDPKTDDLGTARIRALEGLLARQEGRFDDATAKFRDAAILDPTNLRVPYLIKDVLEQQNAPDADAQVAALLTQIRRVQPRNLEALLETARLAAKRGDKATLQTTITEMARTRATWPDLSQTAFAALQKDAGAGNVRPAARRVVILRNTLKAFADYRADADALIEPTDQTGTPLEWPLVLPRPSPKPAPADTGLAYAIAPIGTGTAVAVAAFPLDEKSRAAVFATDGQTVRRIDLGAPTNVKPLPFPGKAGAVVGNKAITALDIDNDVRADLVFVGAGGVRLYRQTETGDFVDALPKAKLRPAVANEAYTGAWALDVEADGDLDILLATPNGDPIVLRNNGDDSFMGIHPFKGVRGVRAFVWADFGGGGVPDAVFVDGAGKLVSFRNERSGLFRRRPQPPVSAKIADAVAMDVDGSGLVDVLLLREDGTVSAIYDKGDGLTWTASKGTFFASTPNAARLLIGDCDNNGAIDIAACDKTTADIRLLDAPQTYATSAATQAKMDARAVVDINGDGLLDIVGLSSNGAPTQAIARATKKYNYQKITLIPANRKIAESPDKRINSFAIGGEIDLRAGLLYVKQPILGPQTHFGLGENQIVNIVRITWPNGNPQSEFNPKTGGAPFVAEQRLGGSCPFLFAWNGKKFEFVTDCIWRSPLGLKINAVDTADVMQTRDWVKIRGDQLVAKDGFYNLVITAELRETHFFDHLSLMTVDHPKDTEIFVDERIAFPQPPLKIYATEPTQTFARVCDDNGTNVETLVARRDTNYLDTFGRGAYQGVTRDHWVEFELPADAPTDKPIYLVAFGWVHPTDTSINVGIGQNPTTPKPNGLSLEVYDDKTKRWTTARAALGFPEGKVKTVVIRLDDALVKTGAATRRRIFRLRTNLEIFWDELRWAIALPDAPLRTRKIGLRTANLRYRGFSVVRARDASAPELPQDYNRLSGTVAQWRDLEGYHTRFGDIRTLLINVDDRYVIMNAGDAMDLRFPVGDSGPPPGFVRDYVLIGDGWVKDGNLNTTFGKTVLPLPAHDRPRYDTAPTTLSADPIYRRYAADWQTYHTRHITNERFSHSLKPTLPQSAEQGNRR